MVTPVLKELVSPDVDLDTYQPVNPNRFGIFVECTIGANDAEGGDLFGLVVCSPEWLANKPASHGIWLRHHLLLPSYSLDAIKEAIARMLAENACSDWITTARKISRHMDWEFEDYKP